MAHRKYGLKGRRERALKARKRQLAEWERVLATNPKNKDEVQRSIKIARQDIHNLKLKLADSRIVYGA